MRSWVAGACFCLLIACGDSVDDSDSEAPAGAAPSAESALGVIFHASEAGAAVRIRPKAQFEPPLALTIRIDEGVLSERSLEGPAPWVVEFEQVPRRTLRLTVSGAGGREAAWSTRFASD